MQNSSMAIGCAAALWFSGAGTADLKVGATSNLQHAPTSACSGSRRSEEP